MVLVGHPSELSRRGFLAAGLALPVMAVAGCTLQTERRGATMNPTASSTTSAAPPTQTLLPEVDIIARYEHAGAHAWGLDVPGIVRTMPPEAKTIALTFDACGGPKGSRIDEALLATLQEQNVPATLFWNKRWIDANPRRAQEIAAHPLFQIENHGTSHKPLSVNGRSAYGIAGTANVAELVEEIEGNRRFLREFLGVESKWFRSGTAHYDDIAVRIARDLGVAIAGFSVNGDAGATLAARAVTKSLAHSSPGAIAIMHMNQPGHGTAEGVRAAIPQLREAGFTFVQLGDVSR